MKEYSLQKIKLIGLTLRHVVLLKVVLEERVEDAEYRGRSMLHHIGQLNGDVKCELTI